MLAHSFLIKSSSKLLVTRTGIKAWTSSISGLWFPWPICMFLKWDLTLAHWTQVSDRCPLGYLLHFLVLWDCRVKHFYRIALNPGLGDLKDVASTIISHGQTRSNRCLCFALEENQYSVYSCIHKQIYNINIISFFTFVKGSQFHENEKVCSHPNSRHIQHLKLDVHSTQSEK